MSRERVIDPAEVSVPFRVIDDETGRVVAMGEDRRGTLQAQDRGAPGHYIVESDADPATTYWPAGDEAPRPLMFAESAYTIAADGQDGVSFDLPAGSSVLYIDPTTGLRSRAIAPEDDGGPLCLKTVVPGVYRLEITPPWPYRTQLIEVTAE